ncbi:MAG: SDR family NAD(P)-dependent oxidoreductase [Streptosporangiales bacterium]|nr:SDR family NAD(P)-dependent oxidoreductase [Streptosporangiales bacterium]
MTEEGEVTEPTGLEDKVAIVTGAGSRGDGIGNGRAAAILLARRGARVVLADEIVEWAEATRAMIESEGGRCAVVRTDVADPVSAAACVTRTTELFGPPDILVNNVGLGGPTGTVVDVDPAEWSRCFEVNVTSMMLMAKHCVPAMRAAR